MIYRIVRPQSGSPICQSLVSLQTEFDDKKACYQLLKTMTKFEKETRHQLYVFIKMKNNSLFDEMRDNSAYMTRSVHSHRHDAVSLYNNNCTKSNILLLRSSCLKKKVHSLTTISWHVTIDPQRFSTLLWVDPILPVSFGVSRVQNFFTGEGRMSRIPTSFTCIGKGKSNHLEPGEDQTKKQSTPQRSYSISSSFRVIIR